MYFRKITIIMIFIFIQLIISVNFNYGYGAPVPDYEIFEDFESWPYEIPLPKATNFEESLNGWGTIPIDSYAIVTIDPNDSSNTVLKLSYTETGQPMSSFFKYFSVKKYTKYRLKVDFKLVGNTNNIDFRLAVGGTVYSITERKSQWLDVEGKPGWKTITIDFTSDDRDYERLQFWMATMSDKANYLLVDNLSLVELNEHNEIVSNELIIGGDMEGFNLEPVLLTSTPNIFGYYLPTESVSAPIVEKVDNTHVLKFSYQTEPIAEICRIVSLNSVGKYEIELKVRLSENFNANNFGIKLISENQEILIIDEGNRKGTWLELENGWYKVTVATNQPLTQNNLVYCIFLNTEESLDNHILLDDILFKQISSPINPFNPDI